MRANLKARGPRSEGAQVSMGAIIGIVVVLFAISALVGPIADEVERADTNANVSAATIAILDLTPLFLGLLGLGAIAVVLAVAFRNAGG